MSSSSYCLFHGKTKSWNDVLPRGKETRAQKRQRLGTVTRTTKGPVTYKKVEEPPVPKGLHKCKTCRNLISTAFTFCDDYCRKHYSP